MTAEVSLARHNGLVIAERWNDKVLVIEAAGSVDMLTAPWLSAAITAAAHQFPHATIIDLSAVDFLALAGTRTLLVARAGTAPPARFGVVTNVPAVGRLFTLLGIDDIIDLYPSVGDALNAMNCAHLPTAGHCPDASFQNFE